MKAPDSFLAESQSQRSHRCAFIAEEGDSVWLYLTHPDTYRPVVSSWLLNLTSAPEKPEAARYQEKSQPPPLPARFVSTGGVQTLAESDQWRLVWGMNGDMVAAYLNDELLGIAINSSNRGWAKFAKEGAEAWAKPFTANDCPIHECNNTRD